MSIGEGVSKSLSSNKDATQGELKGSRYPIKAKRTKEYSPSNPSSSFGSSTKDVIETIFPTQCPTTR